MVHAGQRDNGSCVSHCGKVNVTVANVMVTVLQVKVTMVPVVVSVLQVNLTVVHVAVTVVKST